MQLLIPLPPPCPTLFPYTTLFRSQRHFLGLQLGQRLVEVELAGQPEAVDRAAAVLAEVHLVEVGLEDFLLRVMRLERSEEHTSELQSHVNLVCRLLLEKKNVSH